ncbi:hypothetical protein [Methanobrevibacter millerae]|uniref:Uncharacterized protein n=1 Tax=Methanobrevibacter millerae TaxID=230361 RepID=A0A1G5V2D1_9EURY|nr:hypothetical protein [Methanobrevibacter millerae]SDA39427.1 hypothetical protein SAMN02910315_00255 [Methanobrevibacter millerae]
MYSEDEKAKLMEELKEMEALKVDTGDEGEILQRDLIDFIVNGKGDRDDLIFRIELFTYAFKLFSRKEVKLENNQFTVYLNDSILEYEKIDLIKRDFDKFELVIEAVEDKGEILQNLVFSYHY